MRSSVRRIAFLARQIGLGVAFAALFPLSPESALRLADRYMEALMPTGTLTRSRRAAQTEQTEAALRGMAHFERRARTEEAFYLGFQTLGAERLGALQRYYQTHNDWWIFRQVCAFWRVGGAHRTVETCGLSRGWDERRRAAFGVCS